MEKARRPTTLESTEINDFRLSGPFGSPLGGLLIIPEAISARLGTRLSARRSPCATSPGSLRSPLGAFGPSLETPVGRLLGRPEARWGFLGAHLGASWDPLGSSRSLEKRRQLEVQKH